MEVCKYVHILTSLFLSLSLSLSLSLLLSFSLTYKYVCMCAYISISACTPLYICIQRSCTHRYTYVVLLAKRSANLQMVLVSAVSFELVHVYMAGAVEYIDCISAER